MNSLRPAQQRLRRCVLLLGAALGLVSLPAQDIENAARADAAAVLSDPIALSLRPGFGRVAFTRKVNYRYTHATGLPVAPGLERSTSMHFASATLGVDVGPALSANYTLGWMIFSSEAFDNNLTHEFDVVGRRDLGDWNAMLSHRYSRASTPLFETGGQTQYDLNSTMLRLDRRLGLKTRLQLGVAQGIRTTDSYSDYISWSTDNWLHYLLSEVFTSSIGYSYGYTQVDESPDMDYHQLRGRLRWQLSQRLSFDFRAGVEKRRIIHAQAPDATTPIYGAAVLYRPGETTTITIVGDRSVAPSYFRSQTTRTTDWRINVAQRLLEHFQFNFGYGLSSSKFRGTLGGQDIGREDDREAYDAILSTNFAWGGTISASYRHFKNDSSVDLFSTSGNMVSLELAYGF